jgi:hypothetical protein
MVYKRQMIADLSFKKKRERERKSGVAFINTE